MCPLVGWIRQREKEGPRCFTLRSSCLSKTIFRACDLATLGPIHVFIKPAAENDKLRVSNNPLETTLKKPQVILGSKMRYNLTVKVAATFQLPEAQINLLCNYHGQKLVPIEGVANYPRQCTLFEPGSRLTIDGKRVRLNEIDKTPPASVEDHANVARKTKKRSRSIKKEAKGQNASERPQQPARKKQKTTPQPEQSGGPRSPLASIPSRELSQLDRESSQQDREFSQRLEAEGPAADTRDVEPLAWTINRELETHNPTERLRIIATRIPTTSTTRSSSNADDDFEIRSQAPRDDRVGLAVPSLVPATVTKRRTSPRKSPSLTVVKILDFSDSDGTDTGWGSHSIPFERKFSYDGARASSGVIIPATSSAVENELLGTDSDVDLDTSGSVDCLFLPNLHEQPQHYPTMAALFNLQEQPQQRSDEGVLPQGLLLGIPHLPTVHGTEDLATSTTTI
eukprot:g20576.t1